MRLRLLAAGLVVAAPAVAADPPVNPDKASTAVPALTWDTVRVSSPDSVDELKALQTKVKGVYQKRSAATVGLLLGGQGGGSAGSGVIVSDDGLILTAAHVIGRPREAMVVVLPDGKRVKGVTLGLNSTADSGMARITDPPPKDYPGAKDGKWPFADLGVSGDLKKGQWVVSLGHPGGPKADRPPPVRTGRFLAYEKATPPFRRNDLLCTDATLVGGDSGGPLFDLDGKVIGIHSEIGETLDQNRHVPTERFKAEWDAMLRGDMIFRSTTERDRATRAFMNVVFDEKFKGTGCRIDELSDAGGEKGAAEKAGMEAGDVIVKFDGKAVKSFEDLRNMLPSYKPGETVKVDVDRHGTVFALEVKLVKK
jgi:serine protease Do